MPDGARGAERDPASVTAKWGVWLPRINLGLDLAGGVDLLLEADTKKFVDDRVEAKREQIATAMAAAPAISIGDISTDGGKLSFLLRDVRQIDAARERLSKQTTGVGYTAQRDWDLAVTDGQRIVMTPTQAGITQAIDDAMKTATDVVRSRIDKLGTKEPDVRRQGADRIDVQVPGEKDPQGAEGIARQDRQARIQDGVRHAVQPRRDPARRYADPALSRAGAGREDHRQAASGADRQRAGERRSSRSSRRTIGRSSISPSMAKAARNSRGSRRTMSASASPWWSMVR